VRIDTQNFLATTVVWIVALVAPFAVAQEAPRAVEKFTRSDRTSGATIELRSEATIYGNEIRFAQIARWADADRDVFEPLAQLVVARMSDKQAVRGIAIAELRSLLRDAGVNTSMMNFTGSLTCTITRSDAEVSNPDKLDQLITAQNQDAQPSPSRDVAQGGEFSRDLPAPASAPVAIEAEAEKGVQTLRDLLTADLASRLRISTDSLQMTFRGEHDRLLRLAEPAFRFTIDGQRVGNLGDVSWQVTITSDKGSTRSFIQARAQAWQSQLVVTRPLAVKQPITDADVVERRTLVDRMTDDPLLKREQVVGQVASRDLKPGTVMTGRLVDPVQLVRPGQFVSIEHAVGAVKVKIVARAVDGGSMGQTIRVKNETTREILRVTVTGPQTASINPPAAASEPVALGSN
jgi:flagella basal body P-ring formation protein FlgA